MGTIKEIITTLNGISSVGFVTLVLVIVFLVIKDPTFIKMFFKKVEHKKFIAGVTFEERIAFLENKTLKIENNHIEHINADIQSIRSDIVKMNDNISVMKERLAKIEGKLQI